MSEKETNEFKEVKKIESIAGEKPIEENQPDNEPRPFYKTAFLMLKNFFFNFLKNIKRIILAVVLAIVIWFAISFQVFPTVSAHISDIKIDAAPTAYMEENGLRLAESFNSTATIKIEGKRYDIGNLTGDDFAAKLDYSGITSSGEYNVPVIIEQLSDVNCTIITTNLTATVQIEKITTKTIELKANADDIVIPEDMQIDTDGLSCEPSSITVTGEERLVNSISTAEVRAVYDGTMSAASEVKGELCLYNSSGSKIENPDLALPDQGYTVSVPVCKVKTLPLTVSFTGYSSNFDQSSLKYNIYPEEITISSPDSSIDNLKSIDVGEIALGALTARDLQGVTLVISLPDGYKNISGNKTALITFNDAESYGKLEFTVPAENFNVINAPSNYDITVLTEQLPVTVIGPSEVLLGMTSADIFATVNLLGVEMTEGTKSVTVSFRIVGYNVKAWISGEDYKIDIKATAAPEESGLTE